MRAVFTEYALDMNSCDPCGAGPLSFHELRSLGAFFRSRTMAPRSFREKAVVLHRRRCRPQRFRHPHARAFMMRRDFPKILVLPAGAAAAELDGLPCFANFNIK